jgi:hypothetical protein
MNEIKDVTTKKPNQESGTPNKPYNSGLKIIFCDNNFVAMIFTIKKTRMKFQYRVITRNVSALSNFRYHH